MQYLAPGKLSVYTRKSNINFVCFQYGLANCYMYEKKKHIKTKFIDHHCVLNQTLCRCPYSAHYNNVHIREARDVCCTRDAAISIHKIQFTHTT